MAIYKSLFLLAGILVVPMAVLQLIMRRQVHEAEYGLETMSPWDVRFANSMFGRNGIWNRHREAYEGSSLRSWFVIFFVC